MITRNNDINDFTADYKFRLMQQLSPLIDQLYYKPRLRNLFWEVTTQCNLSCMHCGSDCGTHQAEDSISVDEMRAFFNRLAADFSPYEVMLLITGGEPLLCPHLFEVMEYAAKLGFAWGMTTNGTLLSDSIINKMIKSNCTTVSVSLDGMTQSHNALRRNECFDKVVENTKKLVATNSFSDVQITTVVHKGNIHELSDMYGMLESISVDSWKLTTIDPIGRANKMENAFLSEIDLIKLFDFIRQLRKRQSKIRVSFGCSHYVTPEYEKDIRGHYFFCGAGIITASILNSGDIYACVDIQRKNGLIQGNLKTDDFSEVWQNKFKQFRQRRDKLSSTCFNCLEAQFCRGDSAHTWDFDNNTPKFCIKNLQ